MSDTYAHKDVIKYSSNAAIHAFWEMGGRAAVEWWVSRVQLDYFVIIDNNHILVYIQNELEWSAFKMGHFTILSRCETNGYGGGLITNTQMHIYLLNGLH